MFWKTHVFGDLVFLWFKPKCKVSWMSQEKHDALPGKITIRELRYRVEFNIYYVHEIALITMLNSKFA
jgi:hypothetical protein